MLTLDYRSIASGAADLPLLLRVIEKLKGGPFVVTRLVQGMEAIHKGCYPFSRPSYKSPECEPGQNIFAERRQLQRFWPGDVIIEPRTDSWVVAGLCKFFCLSFDISAVLFIASQAGGQPERIKMMASIFEEKQSSKSKAVWTALHIYRLVFYFRCEIRPCL